MIKHESKSAILLRHWIMANKKWKTCALETKDTRGKATFPLSEFKDKQVIFAEAIRHGKKGVLIRTEGVEGLPDYVFLKNEPSFVAIKYPKGFAIISGETLALEKKRSRTLSWARAQELAHTVIVL
jgi:hypothetical protein